MKKLAILAMATAVLPALAAGQTVDPDDTEALAPLAGPQYTPAFGQSSIGFYGTDLGFTLKHRGQLRILFGDTWAGPLIPTIGPFGDDSQGTICLRASGCPFGGVALPNGDAVESFVGGFGDFHDRPGPPLVFRRNAFGLIAPLPVYDGGGFFAPLLEMGGLKTPVAAFSNGRSGAAAGAFGLFFRSEPVGCSNSCAGGFTCDTSLGIGTDGFACADGPGCGTSPPGICVDPQSPRYSGGTPEGRLRGQVTRLRIGNADPIIQEQYYTKPWDTHRFLNPSATTVDDYRITGSAGESFVRDPEPASGPHTGNEKVLVWGRPSFFGVAGQEAKLYLAVADVPSYSATGSFAWQPRFYYPDPNTGEPRFSSDETQAAALRDLNGSDTEPYDIVQQLSIRWIDALDRWVMLYGGDAYPGLYDAFSQGQGNLVDRNPDGAVFVRFAPEPWGPWSEPMPLLEGGDPDTGTGGQYEPGGILHHPDCPNPFDCVPGELAINLAFGDEVPGFLYGVNLIPEWTEDRGDTVDIYWNVSTFAPYQVVLMKSTITKAP